jgi:Tol biopolymer transport system component
MDEMTVFEQRFEDRVRSFALTGVRPVDGAAVAHAVAVARPRDRGAGSSMRWLALPPDRMGWTIAVALGLLVALLGGALLVGARLLLPPLLDVSPTVTNGWIAFTVWQQAPDGADDDIWLVALGRDARRVVGTDTDRVHQLCPAFSPDGRSLAFGRVEGHGTESFVNADGTEVFRPAAYRQAALVVADVSDDGGVSDRLTVDVGDGLPPPCPVWSADGGQVAFGVNRTSPINPVTAAAGSEVWVVTIADRSITVLPDLLATDLEWSPDGSLLAIASGEHERVAGETLQDGGIHLYAPASGAMRWLDGTRGAAQLTWSPHGRRIAYATRELRVIDIDTGQQRVLAASFGAMHGIGPVWSPDGETVAYQRGVGGEHSEVVLLTPGDLSDESARPRETVVPVTARGSSERLDPYRVTWSPDGQYLLMMAWGSGGGLVAIPASLDGPPVLVAQTEGMVPYDGYPDTTLVPIQTWGPSPSD